MIASTSDFAGFSPESSLYRPPADYFRGGLSRFATGVAVVTFAGVEGYRGITINSFTSISMDPLLVLISIARTAKSHDELIGRPFTVNVLGAEQKHLALTFAGKQQASEPRWVDGELAPRLAGVLSWFECTAWADYDGGDHTIYLGEVKHFGYRSGDALGFVSGQFTTIPEFRPGHEDVF